jgi:hypothetical protein
MDACCESVEKEIDKVVNKFTDIKNEAISTIEEIKSVLAVCRASLSKCFLNFGSEN